LFLGTRDAFDAAARLGISKVARTIRSIDRLVEEKKKASSVHEKLLPPGKS
jgi:hypothetical protein